MDSTWTRSEVAPGDCVSFSSNPYKWFEFGTGHGSSYLWGILHSVQKAVVHDVDVTPVVDQDSKYSALVDVHGGDQGVVREMNRVGICHLEHDWHTRDQRGISQDHWIGGPTCFINIYGSLEVVPSSGQALKMASTFR